MFTDTIKVKLVAGEINKDYLMSLTGELERLHYLLNRINTNDERLWIQSRIERLQEVLIVVLTIVEIKDT